MDDIQTYLEDSFFILGAIIRCFYGKFYNDQKAIFAIIQSTVLLIEESRWLRDDTILERYENKPNSVDIVDRTIVCHVMQHVKVHYLYLFILLSLFIPFYFLFCFIISTFIRQLDPFIIISFIPHLSFHLFFHYFCVVISVLHDRDSHQCSLRRVRLFQKVQQNPANPDIVHYPLPPGSSTMCSGRYYRKNKAKIRKSRDNKLLFIFIEITVASIAIEINNYHHIEPL